MNKAEIPKKNKIKYKIAIIAFFEKIVKVNIKPIKKKRKIKIREVVSRCELETIIIYSCLKNDNHSF